MSVNKFMHPRNIYRNPPDFSQLALKYPEFLQISKLDISGKVTIDFKDPQSLRILTKCLLHSDFGLNVHIPEDRLVPTLPLRLNYILWIEDLMVADENIKGIDIGTGACAVYPLLGAAKNAWWMLGTETDDASYRAAVANVDANHLADLVTIKFNETTSLLEHCFVEDKEATYDFCMCNPPFYSSFQELCESRSTARPPPKNGFTGSLPELITEGGEVEFVRKLINESTKLKDNVKIFTTMLGHKVSLKELVEELRQRGIELTHTEFCQGHTTRWGLAWTFRDDCHLQLIAPPRSESRKKNVPMAFIVPPLPSIPYDSESIGKHLKLLLDRLSITHKLLGKKGSKITMEMKASTDTWSNQRRKRRQQKRLEGDVKIPRSDIDIFTNREHEGTVENNNLEPLGHLNVLNPIETKDCPDLEKTVSSKQQEEENVIDGEMKSSSQESNQKSDETILHALLCVRKQEEDVVLDMEYIGGSSGKDGLHRVLQFIKNSWK